MIIIVRYTHYFLKLENGLLSYENPNYHMDPQRIERNSHLYEEILSELQQQSTMRNNLPHIACNRKDYARLDIASMGVDLKENFGTTDKNSLLDVLPSDIKKTDDMPDENDGKHDNKQNKYNSDSLNKNQKNNSHRDDEYGDEENKKEFGKKENIENIEDKDRNNDLPPGWEKHEDNDGPYYWHIKSGTIQREPPLWPKDMPKELKTPIISSNSQQFLSQLSECEQNQSDFNSSYKEVILSLHILKNKLINIFSQNLFKKDIQSSVSVTRSNTSSALDLDDERKRRDDLAFK